MSGWRHAVLVEGPSLIPARWLTTAWNSSSGKMQKLLHTTLTQTRTHTHTIKNRNVKKADVFKFLLIGDILPRILTRLRPARFPCWRYYLSYADSDISNPIYCIHKVLLTWPLTLCVSCKLAIKLNLDLSIRADFFFARVYHYKVHTLPFVAHETWPVSLLMSGRNSGLNVCPPNPPSIKVS